MQIIVKPNWMQLKAFTFNDIRIIAYYTLEWERFMVYDNYMHSMAVEWYSLLIA